MIRINLLPLRAEKKKETLRQQGLIAVGIVVLLGAAVAAVHITLGADITDLRRRIGERRAEIAKLQAVIGEVKEFRKKKRELEEKISVIENLERRQHGPSQLLHELAVLVPEKLWIDSLKEASGSLALNGVAIDNQTIALFMTKLEASSWFRGVRLEETRQVTRGGASLKSFSIKAGIVYPKAG